MSVVILVAFLALTVAQLIFWENLGEMFGFAASVSTLGLCTALTLIVAARVVATHTFPGGKDR